MQNSKKISTRTLTLNKETLRHLDNEALTLAAGGRPKSFGGICEDPPATDGCTWTSGVGCTNG
jgi:hypothetical protein